MYKIEQTKTKKRYFLGFELKPKKITKTYYFKEYKNALIFALSEQIKIFYCIVSDEVKTTRKTYKNFLTLAQFKKASNKNPLFYLGTRDAKKINIENYYFYLISSNNINKLKKF